MAEPLSSKVYFDGIYIPAGLIVVGTYIVKKDLLPYAVILAVALGALKFFNLRTTLLLPLPSALTDRPP